TITGPCIRVSKRELNSPQAAAFVQSWLGNSIFGHPTVQDPPAALPVCRVSVRYTVADRRLAPMQVDYASDGKTAWVALPPQNLWPGAFVTVHRWTVALPSAVAAFAGKGTPQPVAAAAAPRSRNPSRGRRGSEGPRVLSAGGPGGRRWRGRGVRLPGSRPR